MLLEQVVRKVERPVFKSENTNVFPEYSGTGAKFLLELVETERSPRYFKECVLGILQVYFDGLLQVSNTENSEEQSKALKSVLDAACMTVEMEVPV